MGAHSTLKITKEDATQLLLKKMFSLTEAEMEEMLFTLYGDKTLYNFSVVHEYEEEDEYGYPLQYKGREWAFN